MAEKVRKRKTNKDEASESEDEENDLAEEEAASRGASDEDEEDEGSDTEEAEIWNVCTSDFRNFPDSYSSGIGYKKHHASGVARR
jgi:hypothetical protein